MRATWQSQVRAEPRAGSKRCQSRSARSNVSPVELLGDEPVAGEPDEVAVDVVEVALGGLREGHRHVRPYAAVAGPSHLRVTPVRRVAAASASDS